MGKEEMKPAKKNMTSKKFGNMVIKYAENTDPSIGPVLQRIIRKEVIHAGELLIKEDPFALASYLESISEESRAIFFKIIRDNKNPMSFMEEEQRAMSKGFKCPECGGKSVEGQKLASCSSPEGGEFPMHFSTCLKCKSEIPDHIGFRWEKMTVAQAKEEWEEFKNDEYFDSD